VQKEAIAEYIARNALANIVRNPGLWPHFGNTAALAPFWKLDPAEYCRCIDGLILSEPGNGSKQFKSRTELFIGPHHHDMMGRMYAIRSDVEHLHEHDAGGLATPSRCAPRRKRIGREKCARLRARRRRIQPFVATRKQRGLFDLVRPNRWVVPKHIQRRNVER
jgi:hypothetical protein